MKEWKAGFDGAPSFECPNNFLKIFVKHLISGIYSNLTKTQFIGVQYFDPAKLCS